MPVPQHSVTAAIRFISQTSDAWDTSNVLEERKRMGARTDEHPIPQYFSGTTRFDLDAPADVDGEKRSAKSYLREGVHPRSWSLRRLGIREVARCEDMMGAAGALEAFALGVIGADNLPPGVAAPGQGQTKRLLEAVVDELADAVGMDEIFEVGAAVLKASRAPTPAEKKP
jgi:hypothetical protein